MENKEKAVCNVCGEPMPPGEEMFMYHGYSGDCPKPPLPKTDKLDWRKNIHDLVGQMFPDGIPGVIVNAMDAAYMAGIDSNFDSFKNRIELVESILEIIPDKVLSSNEDDMASLSDIKQEIKEWLEGRRCDICGEAKESDLSSTCDNCWENG